MEYFEFTEELQKEKKEIFASLDCIDREKLSLEIDILQTKTEEQNFWDDPKNASKISQDLAKKIREKTLWDGLSSDIEGLVEMVEMIEEGSDEQKDLEEELVSIQEKFSQAQQILLLSGDFDSRNALLEITSGAGGTEAQDFAEMLLRMYLRFCERKNWKVEILEKSMGTEAGIKSCTLEIKGENAFGLLMAEKGTHRLVRLSPFNSKNLRQTSFAGVMITPELKEADTANIHIPESEVRVDTFRSSGSGGQHANKTDSAVRMVHIPTNITVVCENQRSQHQNKEKALEILKSRLALKQKEEEEKKAREVRGEHAEAAWGTQIRNYVLHPYKLVKDLRTTYEVTNPDSVFDGELAIFHQKYLEWKVKQK